MTQSLHIAVDFRAAPGANGYACLPLLLSGALLPV
jgi:hypothetical protein